MFLAAKTVKKMSDCFTPYQRRILTLKTWVGERGEKIEKFHFN